jgi:hypothetical protein
MSTDDTTPTVEVIEISDLKPCPFLTTTFPERVTARCVCCDDRMECFIDRRATAPVKDGGNDYAIPVEEDPDLLARAASCVGLDGLGGWLLIRSEKGLGWVCRECVRVAIDFSAPEVTEAITRMIKWRRVAIVDKAKPPIPSPPGWKRKR